MILTYIISFLLGLSGAFGVLLIANRVGLVDTPNHRSSHSIPTPKGGGIGILFAFIATSYLTKLPVAFFLPIILVSFMGFVGDRKELSTRFRLIIQFVAAIIVVYSFISTESMAFPLILILPFLVIFIVGTANFYNFMDGINGIAGITGVIAFGLLAMYYPFSNTTPLFLFPVALSLACACLGFLPFNFPNAKVFMGDVGSILLGYVFAVLVVFLSQTPLDFVCYASFLFPFYIDELTTMYLRLKNGENLAQAHRKHFYQILVNENAVAHWKVTMGFAFFQLFIGVSVMTLKTYGSVMVVAFLMLFSAVFVVVSQYYRNRM